jgi:hypothetical protein
LTQLHGTITILLISIVAYLLCISASHHEDLSAIQGKGRFGGWNEISREERCIDYKKIEHISINYLHCIGALQVSRHCSIIKTNWVILQDDKRQLGRSIANDQLQSFANLASHVYMSPNTTQIVLHENGF